MIILYGKNKLTTKPKSKISIQKQKSLVSPNIKLLQKYLETDFKGKLTVHLVFLQTNAMF